MSLHAEGICNTTNWSEEPYFTNQDEKLSLAKVTTNFSGGIVGEGVAQYLMAYSSQSAGSFVGIERIVGSIGMQVGSFVVQSHGTFDADRLQAYWSVVNGSGRGGLTKLRGMALQLEERTRA